MLLKHQHILITGGAGFIGTHLAKSLIKRNQVTVIDHKIGAVPGVNYLRGSFNTLNLKKIFRGQDMLFHLAWSTTPAFKLSWAGELDQNVYPTQKLINHAKDNGIKHLVFVSSAGAVYGDNPTPFKEEQQPHPISNYGKSKLEVENILKNAASENFKVTIFRPTNVIGLTQRFRLKQGIVPAIIEAHQAHQPFTMWGNATKDYLAIDDVITAFNAVAKQDSPFDIYNLASGTLLSTSELLAIAEKIYQFPLEVVDRPQASHDINRLEASTAKAKKILGWKPTKNINQVMKDIFIDSIRS